MYCNKCGNKIEEGTQFCSKCGNSVSNNNVNEKNKNNNKKKWSMWYILVIIVGVIIGIAIIGKLVDNSIQKTNEKNIRSLRGISCVEFIEKI